MAAVEQAAANKDPVVARLRGVAKQYKRGKEEVHVLQKLDLEIPRGRFRRADGPVGLGQDHAAQPDRRPRPAHRRHVEVAASVGRLSERELAKWRAQHFGFVFQIYNLMPVLTAEQNVELPLLLTSLRRAERREHARTALELVGLEDRMNTSRASCRAARSSASPLRAPSSPIPTLLLCDEPTGDLDRKTADDILDLLEELNKQHGKTIVMVTHDPRAAERANRTLHLNKGRLERETS